MDVDLWYWNHEPNLTPSVLSRALGLMSAEEQRRYEMLDRQEDRRIHAATRLMIRTLLSRHADLKPADWRFGRQETGKPYVANRRWRDISFNLSHTQGMIVAALSRRRSMLGVDVERTAPGPMEKLAPFFVASEELADLACLMSCERERRLLRLWVLKESLIKARGLGLGCDDPKAFAFRSAGEGVPSPALMPASASAVGAASFALFDQGAHVVGLCVIGAANASVAARNFSDVLAVQE
ncbi:4'-phosphopantetheinyl transferase family protein [Hartmannibacter diazotrophicus]|uniref:4'-phosphopantetheinyl transferase family protein n=1 Tax=Hartmannibacter diazotrophicus TaxID=1482074 RepID=UPI000C15EB78|nr:4'-phosphopantetheinyl transferase superfamily protein [Hartmannibacter diazotrophicus]